MRFFLVCWVSNMLQNLGTPKPAKFRFCFNRSKRKTKAKKIVCPSSICQQKQSKIGLVIKFWYFENCWDTRYLAHNTIWKVTNYPYKFLKLKHTHDAPYNRQSKKRNFFRYFKLSPKHCNIVRCFRVYAFPSHGGDKTQKNDVFHSLTYCNGPF